MKKILLLGGSAQQIPALEEAKEQGCYTVLCDYLPDNPGRHFADKFYCVSSTDYQAVLEVAKEEKIAGIVAYASDPAAPTAAFVANELGLPGHPLISVELLTNKEKYRSFLATHGFCTPKAGAYSTVKEVLVEIDKYKLPVMLKPVDSSGSKGVSKLSDLGQLHELFENALAYSRVKRVIIEEYVEMLGYQVAGDGFSLNGELVFRCFANDHFASSAPNPYVPVSASFPYNMPEALHDKIHREIQRLLDLLKMDTGAYNFDIRVDQQENVYLMEIGPRSGGNFIPQVIRYATGIDLIEYVIKAALGEDCSGISMVEASGFWSYFAVHSHNSGVLRKIQISEAVRQENIVEYHLNYAAGDHVPAFTGANTSLGILLMRFSSMKEMLQMMDHPEEWINVQLY